MKHRNTFKRMNLVMVALFCFIAIAVVGAVFGQTILVGQQTHQGVLAATRSSVSYDAAQVFTEDGSTLNQGDAWFGNGLSTSKSYTGIRFEGISVPKGAVIENVALQVNSTQDQWINQSTSVYVETTNPTNSFSTSSPPSARTLSSQVLGYSDGVKWEKGKTYEFPSLLQLVPAMDLTNRQTLSLILKGKGGSWGRKFFTAPKLTVTYTTSGEAVATSTAGPTASPTPVVTTKPSSTPISTAQPIVPKDNSTPIPTVPATTSGSSGGTTTLAASFGVWIPTRFDTCPRELHDSYSVVGPDGKRYPT
jgi:hypothetical protein